MKRYMICLFLFVGVSAACLTAGYFLTRQHQNASSFQSEETEIETIGTAEVTQSAPENLAAANRSQVLHQTKAEEFYLVSEDGFLLVFGKDKETICLYTHIPLHDFPEREQERLREGIWFPSMMEVIHYLESYTS
ncbi:hypothetical protein D3Z51_10685 [Clostridiaceae bacterium]|nr:hypothetical protein [Clostridiaceae bacterium]RKI13089.1 hypothetical protein D7V81_10875 [bacterium 1XD21-70]